MSLPASSGAPGDIAAAVGDQAAPGLLGGSVILMAGRAASLIALASTYLVAARVLAVEQFGAVVSVLAAATFVLALLDMGLNSQTQRDVAAAGHLGPYFTTIRWKYRLAALIATTGPLVAGGAAPLGVSDAGAYLAVGPYLAAQLLLTTLVVPDLARGAVMRPALVPALDKVGGLVITALLLGLWTHPAALTVGLLLGSTAALAVAVRSAPSLGPDVMPGGLGQLVRAARPYWMGGVAAQMQSLDTVIVALVAGATQAGYLAGPSRLAGPLTLIPAAVSTLLLSSAATRRHSRQEIVRLLMWILAVLVPLLSALAAFAHVVVPLLLGPEFEPAVAPFRIILAALVVASLNAPLAALLQGEGQASAVGRVLAVAAVSGVTAAVVGAHWGATGASWSVLVVQVIVLAGLLRLLRSPGRRQALHAEALEGS